MSKFGVGIQSRKACSHNNCVFRITYRFQIHVRIKPSYCFTYVRFIQTRMYHFTCYIYRVFFLNIILSVKRVCIILLRNKYYYTCTGKLNSNVLVNA